VFYGLHLIGTSYSTVHGTITVYKYDTIRIGTCILSACFISRSAIFIRSGPHGRGDYLAPLSAPCTSLSALLKRTATTTQAGARKSDPSIRNCRF